MNGIIEIINKIFIVVGVPAAMGGMIYIGRKLQSLDDLKRTMAKVKHNLKVIADSLVKSNISFDPRDLRNYSPVTLTEEGLKRIQDVGFDSIVEQHQHEFFSFIKSEEAKTKYDLEIAAIKSISGLFNKDYFNSIKSYLYNNPQVDEKALKTTLGIYVRDRYLAAHPEITE